MVKPSVDLSQLALDRAPTSNTTIKAPLTHKKRWVSRYVLPLSIALGFLALVVSAAGNRFWPARSVSVIPVVVKRAEIQQSGATLFQAPGWIEPRPTAISVSALVPGVVEELMVVAGQEVQKGESVAKLISIDAELALQQAKNVLAVRHGELNRSQAELSAARIRFENPVHLQVQLADAKSNLTKAKTELGKLPFLIQAAESNVKYAKLVMEGKQSAGGAIPGTSIAKAENEHDVAIASLKELEQRKPNLQSEVNSLEAVVTALEHQLKLLVEESRQVREAEAKVQSADAYHEEAKLNVRLAELALERCLVCAPMNGRILRILAAPGMGLEARPGHSSSTVVEMYDPKNLQVRTDVRLEDIPLVTQGQSVEIQTASSSEVIVGRVLQITSSANVQKNTLEVKVELLAAPTTVGPEMLVTATFLAPTNSQGTATETERILVPNALLQSSDSASFVWIVDENSNARKRIVELEGKSENELVAIKSGLKVTDKLISTALDGLRDGARVHVLGDDPTLGMK